MPHVRPRVALAATLAAAVALVAPAVASAATEIAEIQGASHVSPLNGADVFDVEGVVTAKRFNGFFMQDPTPDADPATSEGIFVFGTTVARGVAVGDLVRVDGRVSEFRPGGSGGFENLTITQIGAFSSTAVVSSGHAIAPTVLGIGGVTPPTEVIEDDASGSVETSGVFDPAEDAIDFYESLEGMLLRVDGAAVVGPTKRFGEITVLPDGGGWATGLKTPRGGILLGGYSDPNPERIIVDDEVLRDQLSPRPSKAMPDMDVGAVVTSPIVGPLDYSFANFKIQATTTPTFTPSTIEREVAAAPADQELAVATFNVENLSAVNPQSKFDQLAGMIVANLRSPDLIGIEEVQDDDGTTGGTSSPLVDASQTWAKLIAAIEAAGGPTYEYRQIDPLAHQDGGVPGGNIRVGFLFRTDRGLSFVDRPGGTSDADTEVVATAAGPQLTWSPGRLGTQSDAFFETRRSLAGEFRFQGKKLFAVVNHFSSKGDDEPLFGRFQPPTRHSEAFRHGQAQVIADFVSQIRALDPNAYVVVLGDINDFEFSTTVDILESSGLTTLFEAVPPGERYSYVFEGNSQVLDQILASDPLLERLSEYDVVHVNAEFARQASDHEPSVARFWMTGRP